MDDPTPARPGIRIYTQPVYRHHTDGARWSTRHGDTPTAAYACACACACGQTGKARQTGKATGARAVAKLAAEYDDHTSACTGTPAPIAEGRTAA
ncbi:hypothetical protein [Streptomyces sp. 2231.1]|uniref:hypothetical protein n=1 Tax=Streptomyces sp. 2231.1 TaxID=1855347 RepID=UPI00210D8684|nr:hypothetical protein [Streptomyces sp. 2231.1]